jgi:hypothetical protein
MPELLRDRWDLTQGRGGFVHVPVLLVENVGRRIFLADFGFIGALARSESGRVATSCFGRKTPYLRMTGWSYFNSLARKRQTFTAATVT